MHASRTFFYAVTIWICLAADARVARAQQAMGMPGMENSVGYLSSGTSIEPKTTSESTPMIHRTLGNWMVMIHANAFLVDVQQSGLRGRDKFFSNNWVMPMMTRQFGRQSVMFRTMLSLEPATITKRHYPLLFQTGETAFGFSIVDGQHPHDFFMELAGKYDFKLGERSQIFVYGGPVGEAVLGPAAFPHRSSASENPLAVLGHHKQDSTHIASNVITLGLAAGPLQVEASGFHGREPNENRWLPDKGKPDSFAARVTIAPSPNWSGQFSTGRINSPEAADVDVDTVRTTASIHHNAGFSSGHVSSSLIWGRNKDLKSDARRIFNSYNFEMTSKFRSRNWIWTRIENVDRDRTLLPAQPQEVPVCRLCGVLGLGASIIDNTDVDGPLIKEHVVQGPDGTPVNVEEDPIGRVQAYTLGYERELSIGIPWLNVGLGVQATLYGVPSRLKAVYGDNPSTVAMFLRFRPTGSASTSAGPVHQH